MRKHVRPCEWAVALVVFVTASPAYGVITRLTPLKDVLAEGQFIFSAKVEKLDPDKPSVVLIVDDDLKGKAPFRRLPINLKGDSEADKGKHTPQLLKRLALELPVVVFANERGKFYFVFVYTNGTWFQVKGEKAEADAVRWSFTHCEPYLRRTFKGTTAELKQVVVEGLAGKKAPPEPDTKEPPGLGPEIKEEKKEGAASVRRTANAPTNHALGTINGPVFAVIPVLVGGPLAILAMLFPAVFG